MAYESKDANCGTIFALAIAAWIVFAGIVWTLTEGVHFVMG